MDQASIQTIQDILARNESLGIAVGKNPSLDEMGAALALYLSLKELGKNVTIAAPSDPLVEISNLVGINKVKKSLESEGGDLVVAFPYQEGEIEKVSYTLENGFLNIIVKASGEGLSFSEQDVQYKRSGSVPQALFVVGVPRLSDLGNLFDTEALKNVTIVNIDNKSDNQGFGEVVLVSSEFSSVSEQVANLIESLGLPLDMDAAQNLMSGISYATDNFQSQKTSVAAFEQAAKLMQKGARRTQVKVEQPSVQGNEQKPQVQSQDRQDRQNQPRQQFRPQRQGQQFGQRQGSSAQARNPFNQPQQPRAQVQSQPFDQTQGKPQNPFQAASQIQSQSPFDQSQGKKVQSQAQSFGSTQDKPEAEKQKDNQDEKDAPPDWLTPKVYKGSALV